MVCTNVLEYPAQSIEYIESGEAAAVLALHGAMGGFDQGQILVRAIWVRGIEISDLGWIRKVYLKDCISFCTYPIVYLGEWGSISSGIFPSVISTTRVCTRII